MNLASIQCEPACSPYNTHRDPGIHDRLHDKKLQLTVELEAVNAALSALEANPETARVLELLSKA